MDVNWAEIVITREKLFIWAHEMIHAVVARELGYFQGRILVQVNGGRIYGNFNGNVKWDQLEFAMITCAPFVFFTTHGYCDNYLVAENLLARFYFDAYLGRESTTGEYCDKVRTPVRKWIPHPDKLFAAAQRYEKKRIRYFTSESMARDLLL